MEEKIMKDFRVSNFNILPSKVLGGVELFNLELSREVLDACKKYDVAVLGIEGFRVLEDLRVPDMGCIVDFSTLIKNLGSGFPAYSRMAAREFIENFVDNEILLEFVLAEFQENSSG